MQKDTPKHTANGFSMQGREVIHVTGVQEVERFDESIVLLCTDLGRLRIDGQQLHVQRLDLASGQVTVQGQIDAAVYEKLRDARSLLERIFS